MKLITVTLSREQLEVLVTLTDNQLFRMKYIDPKMPGHRAHPEDLEKARAAVCVLSEALGRVRGLAAGVVDRRQICIARTSPRG